MSLATGTRHTERGRERERTTRSHFSTLRTRPPCRCRKSLRTLRLTLSSSSPSSLAVVGGEQTRAQPTTCYHSHRRRQSRPRRSPPLLLLLLLSPDRHRLTPAPNSIVVTSRDHRAPQQFQRLSVAPKADWRRPNKAQTQLDCIGPFLSRPTEPDLNYCYRHTSTTDRHYHHEFTATHANRATTSKTLYASARSGDKLNESNKIILRIPPTTARTETRRRQQTNKFINVTL